MKKRKLFEAIQDLIYEVSQRYSKKLLNAIKVLLSKLTTVSDKVENTARNKAVVKKILALISQMFKDRVNEIQSVVYESIEKIFDLNVKEIVIASKKKIKDAKLIEIKKAFYKEVGLTTGGEIIAGVSQLTSLLDDKVSAKVIGAIIVKGIQSGNPIKALIERVVKLIDPKNKFGIAERQLTKNGAFNFMQIQDRILSKQLGDTVGFKHGLYSGTIMSRTRDFCAARNNRIYTTDEIKKWKNIKFRGRRKTGYDPFIHCGDFNCRHHWNWISEEAAKRFQVSTGKIINSYN